MKKTKLAAPFHRMCLLLVVAFCFHGSFLHAKESLESPPQPDDDTLLRMRFDEPDESIVLAENMAIDPIYRNMAADYRPGRFGGALKFTGRPGLRQCVLVPLPQRWFLHRDESRKDPSQFAEIKVPHVIIDNHRGYTLELWVYPQALQDQTIVAALNTAAYVSRAAWQIDLTAEGYICFACGSGLARFEMKSTQRVPIGQWSHIAIVCKPPTDKKQKRDKGGDIQIFLNGSAASEISWMERATLQRNFEPGSDGVTLCIGGLSPDAFEGFFDGLIDELRLSKVPREFEPDPAIFIESRKELFLDDALVAKNTGIKRVLHQPSRFEKNPLLKSQGKWDERIVQPMGVIYDRRLNLFRAWYRGFGHTESHAVNCYAYSRDGLNWEQPKLGLVEYEGSRENNIIRSRCNGFYFDDPLARPGEPSICMTTKLLYGADHGPFKQILTRSEDGLNWDWGKPETMSGYAGYPYDRIRGIQGVMAIDRPLITNPSYFSKIDKLLVLGIEGEADIMKPYTWARIGWDLFHWQNPVQTGLAMTEKNDQAWYGFNNFIDMGNTMISITNAYHGQKPNRWIDFQLACSRDGYHWQHVANQETFFPLGAKDSWDAGMVWYPQLIDLPGEDKYFIFYDGSSSLHDVVDEADPKRFPIYNMGVAFLRKDGFVSVENDGSAPEAILETKPIRFRGSRLYINADAAEGSLRVELADVQGNTIPGFSKQEASAIPGDSIRHIAEWYGKNDIRSLAGKTVILRFYLTGNAKLYSYRFGPADPHP